MRMLENTKMCNGCSTCFSICPKNCIKMKADNEGFLFPQIDETICNNCGLCQKTCPMNKSKIERTGEPKTPKAFAVINKNEQIREKSSSGGVFTLLAEKIINEGGVVFGARFNEKWEVIHDYTQTIDGLDVFRGSKYTQSIIGGTYKNVKKFLLDGRKVLFTGTPCQIGGLKSYLQKDYGDLICIDIICHGVPSPKVWQKYLGFQRKNATEGQITRISFRRKNYGWMKYSVSVCFANKTEYSQIHQQDLFMQAFLKDLCLRKSCYNCGFKAVNRTADITIADFWGVQNVCPEMFDDKGTSLILIQSQKGQEVFDDIKVDTKFMEVDCEKSVSFNSAAFKSVARPKKRDEFMGKLDRLLFDKLVVKYTEMSFPKTRKLVSFVRRGLSKVKRLLLSLLGK